MIARAQALLGTVVTVQVRASPPAAAAAMAQAFARMAHIGRVMSAHDPGSDVGRMGRAEPGQVLTLDAHTVTVLRAAQHWHQVSCGAFHPVKAAQVLSRRGLRPGLPLEMAPQASLDDVQVLCATQVKMRGPVPLDLGGIAKGYAVDQAIGALVEQGISQAIVNAGGDIRVLGDKAFAVQVRHAGLQLRDRTFRKVRRLPQGALATSVAEHVDTQFVRTVATRAVWRSATVMASDCMTADVLTKWALQSSLLCPRLRAVMREHRAKMWRS